MGETTSSSRKRRRDSSASRSRSRSRARKGGSDKSRHSRRSASRSRKHSRSGKSSRRSGSVSSRSSASSRSRSRSRSASRRGKDGRKHTRRSRRSSSPSSRRDKDRKKSSHKSSKKSSRDKEKRESRRRDHRDKERDHRSRSRSRSQPRKDKKSDDVAGAAPPTATTATAETKPPVVPQPTTTATDKSHTSSRRSRSPARKGHRSRSRSRGRTIQSAPAPRKEKKKEAPKPLTFTGISLKATKPKTNGMVASAAPSILQNSVSTSDSATVDDEKQRRRDKLKLWREQQLKQRQDDEDEQKKLVSSFLAADDPVPKRIKLWSLDEAGEEKQESLEEKQKREKQQEEQRQREQKVVEEVDPLDAYMAGLVDEAAIQQSIANPAANVISLDEIQSQEKLNIYGTFLPPVEPLQGSTSAKRPKQTTESESVQAQPKETDQEREAREERELKEFMRALREKREQEEKEVKQATNGEAAESGGSNGAVKKDGTGRIYQDDVEDFGREEGETVDHRSALEILQEAQKKKDIQAVDHTQVEYIPFQKKFYLVPTEIKNMSDEEVQSLQDELEIKIRGKNCPRPLDKWTQCGFSVRMLQLIQKQGYTEPFAIQRQALPAIMSGRDVIGIAKTGSGKTLAFLLPMFRHILHQPPLKEGEGPIGLIMAPARELAQQIYVEAKKFAKGLGMRATAVYGGSSVSEQIGNLKRGSDIVICTPGRMIDILCMNAGKMVSLKRVTYVVLDEADRMFDMGFEPQITKIMMNIRPDRQTLLFSATFPKAVETLARKVLKKPVEITVGARSTASGDIVQYVEVRDEKDKFMRLLQLLGLWYEQGNILVFVNTQQACDQLFQDLMKAGYPGLSLHGGKDQVDRDFTIDDFKRKVRTLMVATSVAGRGLDVKDLVLVINYHCPNHLEDYVHRVGRTGRAGRKGTAYTFISPDEEEYSVDLVKALESGKQVIPPELTELADKFKERVRKGEARYHGSGFKGKGFTFDDSEKNEAQRAADMQKRQYELQEGIAVENQDASDDDDDDSVEDAPTATAAAPSAQPTPSLPLDSEALSAVRKAQQIAQILDRQYKQSQSSTTGVDDDNHFDEELEINDYPQQARWKVTQKEATERVAELTGAAVITRGSYVPAGRKTNPGERKLYLAIEGPSRVAVLDAKRELQRILDETTLQVGLGGDRYGKYNV